MDENSDFTKNPLFLASYWNRPPNAVQGDATGHPVYTAVGYALTNWEMAEEKLGGLYLRLVRAKETSYDPIRRAYGSIESNSGRRKAIEAAAEAYFDDYWADGDIRRAFLRLTEAIGFASKRRDDIAHGIVLGQSMDNVHYGFFLFPPDYNTARTNLFADPEGGDPLYHTMTKYRFTSTQIKDLGDKFRELKAAIETHSGLILSGPDVFARMVKGVDIFGAKLHGR